MIKLKELKNGWQYNESFVPNNEENTDYQQIKEYIADGGKYEKFDWLAEAKAQKINDLKANFEIASKKPPIQILELHISTAGFFIKLFKRGIGIIYRKRPHYFIRHNPSKFLKIGNCYIYFLRG